MIVAREQTKAYTRAFSLVEVLVTVAIFTVIASLTGPSLVRALESARVDAAARDVLNALRSARYQARRDQRDSIFTIDTAELTYIVAGKEYALDVPARTTLGLATAESEVIDGDTASIRFFPDGSSTGGSVTITRDDRSLSINVDWLTGQVTFSR